MFAQYLSEWFGKVVTFEPVAENLACMVDNVRAKNVGIVPCALSDRFEMGAIERVDGNPGAGRFVAGKTVFAHPLDNMGLVDVDFIQLDVEGYELRALKGAETTIRLSWPVIMVELKGLGGRIGDSDQSVRDWLVGLGYRKGGDVNKDTWYVRAE